MKVRIPKDNEIVLLSLTRQELETVIIDAVNASLKFHLNKTGLGEELPEVLTKAQTAKFLNVTTRTIDLLAQRGILRKTYIGGSPRFFREDIKSILEGKEK